MEDSLLLLPAGELTNCLHLHNVLVQHSFRKEKLTHTQYYFMLQLQKKFDKNENKSKRVDGPRFSKLKQ